MNVTVVSTPPDENSGVGQYTQQLADVLSAHVSLRRVAVPTDGRNPVPFVSAPFRAGTVDTDIVHVQFDYVLFGPKGLYTLLFFPLLWLQSRRHGFEIVVTMHEVLTDSFVTAPLVHLKRLYVDVLHTVVSSVGTVVVLSPVAADRYQTATGREDCEYIPHGVDSNIPVERSQSAAKKEFGYDPDEQLVVEPGYISPRKGSDVFVDLARRCPELSFLLAGGPPREQYRSFFERLKTRAPANVQVTGRLSEESFHTAMQAADVVVLPYNETEQGGVVNPVTQSGIFNWCAAHGLPVLASDCDYFRIIEREWEAVRLVDLTSLEATEQTLRAVLADDAERERLQESIDSYADAHTLEAAGASHASLYERLVEP